MKIAIDCHTLEIENWAGKEQFLNFIIQELIKLDKINEFVLYFRRPVVPYKRLPLNWQTRSINLPTPLWQIFVLLDCLIKKIDILFAPCAYLLPALNFFMPAVIIIFDLTTFLPEIKETHKKTTRLREGMVLKLAIKNSIKSIAISANTKQDAVKWFKVDPNKIKVIYGAASSRYCLIKNTEQINKILTKHQLPNKFILTVGTLEPRKNHKRLIEAYNHLINYRNLADFKLVMVGKKGWYYDEIFAKVKQLKLEKKVIFTDYLPDDDLPYLYNAATCFVYPSLYEGFGLPVIEAMACGCPVITSNISSLPEVVGEAAILVNPYNSDEIARALAEVLTNSSLRYKLRRDGLKQAQKFSWARTATEILDLFGSLV